jgi:hypothetical protein
MDIGDPQRTIIVEPQRRPQEAPSKPHRTPLSPGKPKQVPARPTRTPQKVPSR